MKNHQSMSEWVGWVGVGLLLLGYILNSFGLVGSISWKYQAINLLGNLGLLWVGIKQRARQSVAINGIFIVVCLAALIRIICKH